MKKLWLVIKWFFSYHGMSEPPTEGQFNFWLGIRKMPIIEKVCKVCDKQYWTPMKTSVCPRLRCYLTSNGGKNGNKRKHKVYKLP